MCFWGFLTTDSQYYLDSFKMKVLACKAGSVQRDPRAVTK